MSSTKQPYMPVIQVEGTEYFPERVASLPFSPILCLLPRFDNPACLVIIMGEREGRTFDSLNGRRVQKPLELMQAFLFPSSLRSDKTIATAWTVLALFGAAQLFAVAFHYAGRARAAKALGTPSITASATKSSGVAQGSSATTKEGREASGPSINSLTQPPASIASASKADRLLGEAKSLRDRGDTTNALAMMQEMTQQDPKNATVLAEMAKTYESMQSFDRSNETWRRVQNIGPDAGLLYDLAELKLKLGVPASVTSGSPASAASAPAVATAPTESDGIPDGSTFGITEAKSAQINDPDAEMHLVLKVSVKARPNTPIDYAKVKIQIFFYDMVDNKDIKLTDADVSYEWLTPDHNWAGTNPEILAVTYLRTKRDALSSEAALSAAAAAVTPSPSGKKSRSRNEPPPPEGSIDTLGQRKYLGYIVRVYYKDQLQSVRAEPTKLLNLFPPPFTAPAQ
jgi:tetratricopeptide (TPR) repeat protein